MQRPGKRTAVPKRRDRLWRSWRADRRRCSQSKVTSEARAKMQTRRCELSTLRQWDKDGFALYPRSRVHVIDAEIKCEPIIGLPLETAKTPQRARVPSPAIPLQLNSIDGNRGRHTTHHAKQRAQLAQSPGLDWQQLRFSCSSSPLTQVETKRAPEREQYVVLHSPFSGVEHGMSTQQGVGSRMERLRPSSSSRAEGRSSVGEINPVPTRNTARYEVAPSVIRFRHNDPGNYRRPSNSEPYLSKQGPIGDACRFKTLRWNHHQQRVGPWQRPVGLRTSKQSTQREIPAREEKRQEMESSGLPLLPPLLSAISSRDDAFTCDDSAEVRFNHAGIGSNQIKLEQQPNDLVPGLRARQLSINKQQAAINVEERLEKRERGKRCKMAGCLSRMQKHGLCWKHGGVTMCIAEGCNKRAKARNVCWSHGGGTPCRTPGCSRISVSRGACWAHGGGKRCSIDGCQRASTTRTNNMCVEHFHLATSSGISAS